MLNKQKFDDDDTFLFHLPSYACSLTICIPYLSPSRAELNFEQCISSNHPCLLPRREHLPISVPILAGVHGWSPASFSSVFPFSSRSPVLCIPYFIVFPLTSDQDPNMTKLYKTVI